MGGIAMTAINTAAQAEAMRHLSPQGKTEFLQLLHYLGDATRNPSGWTPEGSIPAIVNKQSPEVREAFSNLRTVISEPRHAPFQEKWTERQYAERLGMDPDATETCLAALDGAEVAVRLQERMGDDSDRPVEEPSARDILSAAYDHISRNNDE